MITHGREAGVEFVFYTPQKTRHKVQFLQLKIKLMQKDHTPQVNT